MKLDREQLGKIVHHVLACDYDEKDRMHFRRFTASQQEVYKEQSQDWFVRTNASSGVTFDFMTDSDYIDLDVDLEVGSAHSESSFDLYVDGIFTSYIRYEDLGRKSVCFSLPEGEHRITVYFPWTVKTIVNEVHLSEGAGVVEVIKRAKAIVFGDSISQGYIAKNTSLSYANQVARETDIELVNQGIGGYYFEERSIDASLVSYGPDLIIVAYGTNDYSRCQDKEIFRTKVSGYIRKLTSLFPNTKILAILPIYRNDKNIQKHEQTHNYTLDEARHMLIDIYTEYGSICVLKETGIPHIAEAFSADYLHPNNLGFTFMAGGITKELKQMMSWEREE